MIPQDGLALLDKMRATAEAISQIVEVEPFDTPEAEQRGAQLVRVIQTIQKEAEAARKAIVGPLKAQTKEVDTAFREPRNRLAAVDAMVRRRLQEAAEAREATRRAALATVQAAQDLQTANAALATVQEAPPTPGVSQRWGWEIVAIDPAQVPDDFKIVDVQKLKAICKDADRGGADPSVPGVRFERKAHAIVRGL